MLRSSRFLPLLGEGGEEGRKGGGKEGEKGGGPEDSNACASPPLTSPSSPYTVRRKRKKEGEGGKKKEEKAEKGGREERIEDRLKLASDTTFTT